MNSRCEELRQTRQTLRLVRFRSSAAAGIVIVVLAVAALLPKHADPGASLGSEFIDATAPMTVAEPARVPEHIRESAGTDPVYPHEYVGQPSVF